MGMVILFVYDANNLQHSVQAVGEYIKTTVVACLTSSIYYIITIKLSLKWQLSLGSHSIIQQRF